MNGRNTRFPFTPSQWQELEHQALIYKYMASGISIPPDLLFSIRRTYLDLDSPLSSRLLPNHPQHFGWNYLQMGLGRKIDPEPGRCRRTDGKKWRCSKEAYPDSKYCERHMHRGKNRSRKPVEVFKSTPTSTTTTNTNASSTLAISSITKNNAPSSLSPSQHSCYGSNVQHSFLYPHQQPTTTSSRSSSSGFGLSFEDNSAPLFQNTTDYRYVYGQKEEVDEYAFFKEPSGIMKSLDHHDSWQLTPLTMSSSSSSSSSSTRQRSCSALSNDYSNYLQLQSLSDHTKQQGMYMLGGESETGKCTETLMMKLGKEELPQKTIHRFIDEWPHKGRESWLDLDDKSSTTQLSISIPTSAAAAHDFSSFNS